MGTFLYSNKNINTERVIDVFRSRGHKNISVEKKSESNLVHAGKILFENNNYLDASNLKVDGDDFVIGIGLFFLNGMSGKDVLYEVYKNIESILLENPIYGHYAFCVRKSNITYIFNDTSGMMRLYYYQKGDEIIVSSSMLAVVSTINNPKFDKVKLAACLANKNVSIFDGVEIFHSYKYLKIEGGNISWHKKKISHIKTINNHKEAVEFVKELLSEQVNQLRAIGNERINIELTGGLDSRLTACVLKTGGFNYGFVHFPDHNKTDYKIAHQIAKGLKVDIEMQGDSSTVNPTQFKDIYGEFDFCFNFFNHHANARRNMKNRYQFTGGYGEDLDTPQIYTTNSRKVDNLIYNAIIKPSRNTLKKIIRKKVVDYLTNLYSEYGYTASMELNDENFADFTALMDASLGNDSRTISAYNAVATRYGIFSEWHFRHSVMGIAFDAKRNRKLTLSLISDIDPELGSYPFSSHMLTKGESVNEAAKHPFHYKNRAKLKNNLPDFVLDWYLRKKGSFFDSSLLSDIDFNLYKDIINIKKVCSYTGVYRDVLQRLYSIEIIRKVMDIKM